MAPILGPGNDERRTHSPRKLTATVGSAYSAPVRKSFGDEEPDQEDLERSEQGENKAGCTMPLCVWRKHWKRTESATCEI